MKQRMGWREFQRWLHYFRLKDKGELESRTKEEWYLATIAHEVAKLRYVTLRRYGEAGRLPLERFLMDFSAKGEAKKRKKPQEMSPEERAVYLARKKATWGAIITAGQPTGDKNARRATARKTRRPNRR
jgi:hypothetical protein